MIVLSMCRAVINATQEGMIMVRLGEVMVPALQVAWESACAATEAAPFYTIENYDETAAAIEAGTHITFPALAYYMRAEFAAQTLYVNAVAAEMKARREDAIKRYEAKEALTAREEKLLVILRAEG
jgi:hypothetical protein